jgi:hypothetical protein
MKTIIFILLVFLLNQCVNPKEESIFRSPLGIMLSIFYPPTNEITRYAFEKKNNSGLQSNISSEILGKKIKLTAPFGTQTDGLVASYDTVAKSVYINDTLQQSDITPNHFANPVSYKTIAPDDTTALYEVSLEIGKETSKELKVFGFSKKHNPSIVEDTNGVYSSDTTST